jgi:hypothetical protein
MVSDGMILTGPAGASSVGSPVIKVTSTAGLQVGQSITATSTLNPGTVISSLTFGGSFSSVASVNLNATAITAGIRATSNDASGNRFLLAIPVGTTNDLVTGGVRLTTAATRALVGIGSEVGGSGASGSFTAQNQVYRFLGATFETVNVVGR